MTEAETRDYLNHHLRLVGRADHPLSDAAAARAAVTEVTAE
jgi:hypothetical protein